MPDPCANRSQSALGERTQLLRGVGGDGDATQLLERFSWMLDEQTRREAERIEAYRLRQARESCAQEGHTFTVVSTSGGRWCIHCGEVPPFVPAQPMPVTNGEPYNDHPWCRRKAAVIALLLGVGVAVGVVIGFLGAVALFAVAVSQ